MDIKSHDQLPGLADELKTRWPAKFTVIQYHEIKQLPVKFPPAGTVLYSVTDLRQKMKDAGYWHRGFPGVDLYWRA